MDSRAVCPITTLTTSTVKTETTRLLIEKVRNEMKFIIIFVSCCTERALLTVGMFGKFFQLALNFKQCLKNEQECFIGIKTTRLCLVVVDPINHVLRVFWTSSNTFLKKSVSIDFITIMLS